MNGTSFNTDNLSAEVQLLVGSSEIVYHWLNTNTSDCRSRFCVWTVRPRKVEHMVFIPMDPWIVMQVTFIC